MVLELSTENWFGALRGEGVAQSGLDVPRPQPRHRAHGDALGRGRRRRRSLVDIRPARARAVSSTFPHFGELTPTRTTVMPPVPLEACGLMTSLVA